MELAAAHAVQADGGALGEGGGPEAGRHGSVGGHLVGGDGRPRQRLGRRGRDQKFFRWCSLSNHSLPEQQEVTDGA